MRLEAHRLKFIHSGRRGPLLSFHELNENERQFFIEELTRDASVRRLNISEQTAEHIFDRMLLDILTEWGIMCPHPKTSVEETPYGHRCHTCGCDVISGRRRKKPAAGGR